MVRWPRVRLEDLQHKIKFMDLMTRWLFPKNTMTSSRWNLKGRIKWILRNRTMCLTWSRGSIYKQGTTSWLTTSVLSIGLYLRRESSRAKMDKVSKILEWYVAWFQHALGITDLHISSSLPQHSSLIFICCWNHIKCHQPWCKCEWGPRVILVHLSFSIARDFTSIQMSASPFCLDRPSNLSSSRHMMERMSISLMRQQVIRVKEVKKNL